MEMLRFQSYNFERQNDTLVFLKKILVFQKICFKVQLLKISKFPEIVTENHADLSNEGLFWKSLAPFFRRIYALSVDFKIKPLNRFPMLRQKPTQILS